MPAVSRFACFGICLLIQNTRSTEEACNRHLQEQETIEKANVLLQKLGYRVMEQQDSEKVAPD